MRFFCLIFLIVLVSRPAIAQQSQQATLSPDARFEALLDREWEYTLKTDPSFASYLGDKRYDTLWPDRSLAAYKAKQAHRLELLQELQAFQPASLNTANQLNYRLFLEELQQAIAVDPFQWYLVPLNQREGIQTEDQMVDVLSFTSVKDYENWIHRLQTFAPYMDQTIALMQAGVESGIVHAKVVMNRLPAQIRRQIVNNPEQSLFYKAFKTFPDFISPEDQQRLRAEAKQAISNVIVPSFQKFETFFLTTYLPACYEKVGVWQIPDGKAFYAQKTRQFTTTSLTPEEVHQLGLDEVARIRTLMEQIVKEVEFDGTFNEFLHYLRTDPQFYFDNPNDLFREVEAVCKRVDPQLVKLFKTLPRTPYGVAKIPESIAPDTTAAYYMPPSADGLRAGNYYFNVYKPESRPKYTIEVLSLHEAVPGHHLQIALAQELEDIPEFRRYGGYTAFIEGWGLYSESLGKDLGLYKDPYSRFGQFTYEMWRAIRLVVDTGMHYKGWSRQQAIELFQQNTAKSLLDIENEVDRYIAWPGQALAYKVGELKIQQLRSRAEEALGEQFNLREFHDEVLQRGAIPLAVLEEKIDEWIDQQAK